METMSDYTIYCTEAQTKKALELGAQIDNITHHASCGKYYISGNNIYDNGVCYFIPTAEQMIGWFGKQGLHVDVIFEYYGGEECYYYAFNYDTVISDELFMPRKEATLIAIDAALEYLTNNKK